MKENKKEISLQFLLAIIIFMWSTYRLKEVMMPILLDDEFAYWSNSSFFMGIDWSSVTQRVGYYSYGYSLILVLIRIFTGYFFSGWEQMYQTAVVLNAIFLVISYVLAIKICKRYLHNMHWAVRDMVCFVAVIYPSNMIYAHTTMTECTLTVLFWVFAYVVMKVIDHPGIFNHICLACVSFYMYAVHQRCLSILITAILLVGYIRLVRINKMRHTIAFASVMFGLYLIHSIIKNALQNVNYLGMPSMSLTETVSIVINFKTLVILVVVAALLLWLWMIEKGRIRLAASIMFVVIVAAVGVLISMGGVGALANNSSSSDRLATNDFSGQWGKLAMMFSLRGLIRLGTSVVGKWFYLAAGTGLVICWGMKETIKNAFWMMVESVKRAYNALAHKNNDVLSKVRDDWKDHIWMLTMFFAWAGAFMVCAIYKEGLYKVDDLVNGRYIEYLIGILIIISADSFFRDQHWLRTWIISLLLLIVAGAYCQYVYDELQRTEFELAHAVMFGRVFWNYESPTGKVRILLGYVIPLSTAFVMIAKAFGSFVSNYRIAIIRCCLALLIPIFAWNHLARQIEDRYVVVRNEKQSGALPKIAGWIRVMEDNCNIYFVNDNFSYKQAELLQFMVMDYSLEMVDLGYLSLDEDAIYIMHVNCLEDPRVQEKCESVVASGNYCMVLNKNQDLMQKWKQCYDR